jgi:hypothetical protein
MKTRIITLFTMLLVVSFVKAQSSDLAGSWTAEANGINHLLLISDSYFSHTMYGKEDGAFIMTMGGQYAINDYGQTRATIEFNSQDPSMVGMTHYVEIKREGDQLRINGTEGMVPTEWKSADLTSATTPLTGPWLMAGRKNQNGEISRRDTDVPRKTMKLLTGTKFQWIAFNTSTGEFFGSGGGSYEAKDGKYVEKIEFFSRDNSRVGAELPFNFEVQGVDWHHSGKSSKGDPMYEVWTKRK